MIVPDDQLSLAIGRKGQNVRLAAQLLSWRIDITSESKSETSSLDDKLEEEFAAARASEIHASFQSCEMNKA